MSAKRTDKIDLFKTLKRDYAMPKKPLLVEISPANYLAIDGAGKPGAPEFQACVGALYAAAYTIKMTRKFGGQQDYAVCKLEAQWWAGQDNDFSRVPPEQWQWKLMIRTPDFVQQEELDKAVAALLERGKDGDVVSRVRLQRIDEGRCVQMLHVGPYDKVGETITLMKAFAEEQHYVLHGRHHEIYLSDPRRIPPARLKTILREPVQRNA
jgi:hypothetical protein